MVKISDIYRKEGGLPEEEPKGEPGAAPDQKIPIREIHKDSVSAPKPVESISVKDASGAALRKMQTLSKEETEKLYQDSLLLIKSILEKGLKQEPIEVKEIKEHIEKLVDQLSAGNSELINLTNNSTPLNYLYAHSVNVCMLSVILGIGIGYNREQLIELGVASFLHDIGMVKVTDVSVKSSKLSDEDYDKIKNHPVFGVEMLEMVKDISQAAIYVAREHHERPDGKGYPKGLKGNQIEEYAKVVSTVDTFEALTHDRAYRVKLHPYEAVREILKNKEHFDFKLLKALIEQIGIFPVGSWVVLSTNEIAVVVDVNKDSPLKPVVKVIFDSQERKLSEEKIINFTQYPTLYIKKPISEPKQLTKETAIKPS